MKYCSKPGPGGLTMMDASSSEDDDAVDELLSRVGISRDDILQTCSTVVEIQRNQIAYMAIPINVRGMIGVVFVILSAVTKPSLQVFVCDDVTPYNRVHAIAAIASVMSSCRHVAVEVPVDPSLN